jgi:type VI secretion system protein
VNFGTWWPKRIQGIKMLLLSADKVGQWRIAGEVLRSWCLALPILATLSACGNSPPKIDTRNIDIQVSPKANHDAAVAIDIVFVFDQQLLTQLQGLGAKDWFRQRDELRTLYPTGIAVSSYEVVPGQLLPIEKVSDHNTGAIGAFAFANYQMEGAHRARLDSFTNATIRLDENDLVIIPATG